MRHSVAVFDTFRFTVNLQDLRKGLSELRDGLKRIKDELGERITEIKPDDRYYSQMLEFVAKANSRVEDLVDNVNLAEATFSKVVRYYGEEDRNISTSEFYAIFKTFVSSYKVRARVLPLTHGCTYLRLVSVLWVYYRNVKLTISVRQTSEKQQKRGNELRKSCRQVVPERDRARPSRVLTCLFWIISLRNSGMAIALDASRVATGQKAPLTLRNFRSSYQGTVVRQTVRRHSMGGRCQLLYLQVTQSDWRLTC